MAMAGRSYKTEAVVLRSFRLGEADRVLHIYTLDSRPHRRGREGNPQDEVTVRRAARAALARRADAASGLGELQTVTGVELVRSHHDAREQQYRLGGRPARRRGDAAPFHGAGGERARVSGADALPRPARRPRAARMPVRALDPLALSFQLKLLWLSGYLPHLTSCADCGAESEPLVGYSPQAGGAVCSDCASRRLARALARGHRGHRRRCSRGRSPKRGTRASRSARRATRSR